MSRYLVAPSDTLDWNFPLHAAALRHVLRHAAAARQASLAAALLAVDPTRSTAAAGVMDACAEVAAADAAATTAPEDGGRMAAAAVLCAATQPQLHVLHSWALQAGAGVATVLHATPHDPLCIMSDLRRVGVAQPVLQAASGPLSSTVARLVRCCICIASLRRRPSTAERLREALSDASHLRAIELDHPSVGDDAIAAIVDALGERLRLLRLPNAPRLSDAAFAIIGAGTQLATLAICGARVTDKGLAQLSMTADGIATRLADSLETLDLGTVGPRVTSKGTETLQRLRKLTSLRIRLHNGAADVAPPVLLDASHGRLPSPAAPVNIEMTPVESTTSGLSTPALSSATSSMWSFTSVTPSAALLLSDHRHEPLPSASACAGCLGLDAPPLVSIDFSGSGASVGAATLRAITYHLRAHATLRDLRLANTSVNDAMLATLADAGAARYLRTLDLSRTQITDEGLALYVSACSKDRLQIACPLETLILRELVISATGLAHIGHAVGLQRLVLDGCPLVGTAALECICQCTALTALSLLSCGGGSRNAQGGEAFTSSGFRALAHACTQLRSVSVADTGINDMMISHLAALPKLRALSLAHNANINGACFITFASHAALVAVDLAGCEYFDAVGVYHVAAVGGLRHLDLVSAKLMSDEALAQLLEGNPHLERLRFTLHSCITDAGLRNIMAYGPALRQVEMYPAPEENGGDIMAAMVMAPTSRLDRKLITALRLSGVRVFYDNSWTE